MHLQNCLTIIDLLDQQSVMLLFLGLSFTDMYPKRHKKDLF